MLIANLSRAQRRTLRMLQDGWRLVLGIDEDRTRVWLYTRDGRTRRLHYDTWVKLREAGAIEKVRGMGGNCVQYGPAGSDE